MAKKIFNDFKYKKFSNNYLFLLRCIIFFFNMKNCLLSICNENSPIRKNEAECVESCTANEFTSGACVIENEKIKTQKITDRVVYSASSIHYAAGATTPHGNLICSSSYYQTYTQKYYYGLKQNGRPLFIENSKETFFSITDSDKVRCEGTIYAININGIKDKEYIVGFGNNAVNFEIYDFISNEQIIIYKQLGTTFFGTGYNSFQRSSIFKLNNSDQDYYIISIIAQPPSSSNKCFYIMKFLFTDLDITQYSPKVKFDKLDSASIQISSCFQTDNNYIFCLYLDRTFNYKAIVYDNDINYKKDTSIYSVGNAEASTFNKCVHFIGEAGAFIYLNTASNFEIQFKQYISDNIIDYFSPNKLITISNNNYQVIIKVSDMIKIGEKKFCLSLLSSNGDELNIFIINNYVDEKIKINHYNIKINNLYVYVITDEAKLTLYNDLIALASNGKYNSQEKQASIIIFGFPNSTDFSLDITDYLTNLNIIKINFKEKCTIENNLFGYVYEGIKIINISDGYKLLSFENKIEIKKNDTLYDEGNAELQLTKDLNDNEKGRIIYTMVVTEPNYNTFIKYCEEINDYCGSDCSDEEGYFIKNLYEGRNSYFDIIIDSNTVTNDCQGINENCVVCLKTSNICIVCKYSYEIIENNGKLCLNLEDSTIPETCIPTIIPTTNPAIIPTTIPTNIQTTKPTIIPTNIPTLIPTINPAIIPTTIPSNIQTTNPTIIPTNILTTIPLKTIYTINEITTLAKETIVATIHIKKSSNVSCTNEDIIKNECHERKIDINLHIFEKIKNFYC